MTIFPELSLNGYLLKDNFVKDSFSVNECQDIFSKYKKDFIISCALKEKDKIYNASIFFNKGKIEFIHRKLQLPNYNLFEEKRYFTNGENIGTFQWQNKNCAILICEDAWNQKYISILKQKNLDYIFIPSSSPARGFNRQDNRLEIEEKWLNIQKNISIKTKTWTFFTNRVGFEDGLGFWGGSKIIDKKGNIHSKLDLFTKGNLSFDC